jgi:hypothetical protein
VLAVTVAGAASAAAALAVTAVWDVGPEASVLLQAAEVGVAIVLGMLVFLAGALILRVGEVDDLRQVLLRRFRG